MPHKLDMRVHICNPNTGEAKGIVSEVQGHVCLLRKFEASMEYRRYYFKDK